MLNIVIVPRKMCFPMLYMMAELKDLKGHWVARYISVYCSKTLS